MSLRDFNAPFPADPRALHNEPSGNGVGLDTFHTKQPEDLEPNNMPKIIGAVAVALMVSAAGIALYNSAGRSMQPKPVVASNNLPAPPAAPVAEPAAMTPDANMPASAAADATPAPAAAPVKEASAKDVSAPVAKKHKVASTDSASSSESASSGVSARMAADSTQSTVQPQQQQAIAAPTPSAPSSTDVASNNTQSGVAVSPNATTASDIPAPAQNNPVTPQDPQATPQAPDQQAQAAPAPAQTAGQVNQ